MRFFWYILMLLEGFVLVVLLRHLWDINAKKAKMEIISYREKLRYRKVISICSILLLGGIISALIVAVNF